MSKKTTYRQCHLRRKTETGAVETVSWIPSRYAKPGWILDLKENGEWSHGWRVTQVSDTDVPEPPDWRKLIRGHRKMTGDSTPRTAHS